MDIQQILERLKVYYQILRNRWWALMLTGALLGLVFAVFAFRSQKTYTSLAVLHPDVGTGSSALAGLSSDPLSMIFGGSGGKSMGTKQIIGVLLSRRISEAVAGDSILIDSTSTLLADAVAETLPAGFSPVDWILSLFSEPPPPPTLKAKVINVGRVLRSIMEVETNDQGFVELKISFPDPELLEAISNSYIEQLDAYYKSQKTEKADENIRFYEKRSDSVKREIDKNVLITAKYVDKNKYGTSAITQLQGEMQQTELEMLGELYKIQMMSLEQAKGQRQQNSPIIQVLDYPDRPYDVSALPIGILGILGFILGLMLAALYRIRHLLSADLTAVIQSMIESSGKEEASEDFTDP